MTCKNHPLVKAKRRCFQCKSSICPQCQLRKNRHLFCSEICFSTWQSSADEKSLESTKLSKQLDQILDVTDAALDKNKTLIEERLSTSLQWQSNRLEDRLREIHLSIDKSVQGLGSRLANLEEQLHHQRDLPPVTSKELNSVVGEVNHQNQHLLQETLTASETRMQALLEQSRLNLYRGLELMRERAADLFENNQQVLQNYLGSQNDQHTAQVNDQSAGLKQMLNDFRAQLDQLTRDAVAETLNYQIAQIKDHNLETISSVRQENTQLASQTTHELKKFQESQTFLLQDGLAQQQQLLVNKLDAIKNEHTLKLESIHQNLETFLNEDLKRVATEIKFLDRFLDRFRTLADEERRSFNDFIRVGDQRLAQTMEKLQQDGKEVLAQSAKAAQGKFETTLKEVRAAVGERLRLIPKSFQLSPMSRVTLGTIAALSLLSPLIVIMKNQNDTKPVLTETAIASIAPSREAANSRNTKDEEPNNPAALVTGKLPSSSRLKLQNAADKSLKIEDQGNRQDLLRALDLQLSFLRAELQKDPYRQLVIDGRLFHFNDLYRAYAAFREYLNDNPDNTAMTEWLQQHFDYFDYQAATNDKQITVTSYYAPELHAGHQRNDRFRFPIYPTPDDIQSRVPYYTRDQIDNGNALDGKIQPIAYLEHDIDRYFLQMQGSGRLVFEDGKQSFVSYESDNGYPFVSLSTLASRDKLKIEGNAGMQGIRNYFTQHPELLSKYAKEMRRYIFFSFKKQAIGTLQVPVVPLRTIAVDPKRIPLGLMGFLKTRQPVLDQNKQLRSFKELSLLVFSHDTGNAITNDHIDLFWGFGDLASVQASSMNERGKLTLLIPKQP